MRALYFVLIVVLSFALLLLPLCAFKDSGTQASSKETFRVYITKTAEIKEVSAVEYCVNVAANNLEKGSHNEAIKSEIVAAYTLALYSKNTSESKNFDFNDSFDGYIETEDLKNKWGDDFSSAYTKFTNAANEVFSKAIYYNDSPILALRHKASAGFTENAKNILNEEIPYLTGVESAGDLLWDGYITEIKVGLEEMKNHLKNQGLTPTENPQEYFTVLNKTTVNNVLKIKVLGKEFSGEDIKNIFNLPSVCFSVEYKEESFVFTVKGSGNMLGLSRVGAEYMAQNGADYIQILNWYYPGCVIK